jgi:hypothetical protein
MQLDQQISPSRAPMAHIPSIDTIEISLILALWESNPALERLDPPGSWDIHRTQFSLVIGPESCVTSSSAITKQPRFGRPATIAHGERSC